MNHQSIMDALEHKFDLKVVRLNMNMPNTLLCLQQGHQLISNVTGDLHNRHIIGNVVEAFLVTIP